MQFGAQNGINPSGLLVTRVTFRCDLITPPDPPDTVWKITLSLIRCKIILIKKKFRLLIGLNRTKCTLHIFSTFDESRSEICRKNIVKSGNQTHIIKFKRHETYGGHEWLN